MKNKILLLMITTLTASCGLNPQNANIDLQETLPETKSTVFSDSLLELGRVNKIFGRDKLKVMVRKITDNTGTALATKGEIPSDITEMLKSALNGVGGNIFYIPYDPTFMQNTEIVGYSDWKNKEFPDIILSGGITEFDRAMVTKGENTDLGLDIEGSPFSLDFGDKTKSSLASITLDFNLIDFKTFTGIPHMQAINNIKVHKGLRDDSLGFTIYGASVGVKGTIKKIQGRHAATRLLVQLSLIQVLGRYQRLPYWKLLPGTSEDPTVISLLTEDFYALKQKDRIVKTQEYLILMGKDIDITGELDSQTLTALNSVAGITGVSNLGIEQYLTVFRQIPLDASTLGYRSVANSKLASYRQALALANMEPTQPEVIKEEVKNDSESLLPVSITLTTNQPQFSIDDYLVISFTVDKPMYVRLVTVNSEGKISNLFPNPYQPDNYVQPGRQYQIPPKNAEFTLKVRGPAGTDKIRAIAGIKPVTAEDAQLNPDGSFKIDPSSHNFASAERDILIR
jgi:hypothetical protein